MKFILILTLVFIEVLIIKSFALNEYMYLQKFKEV